MRVSLIAASNLLNPGGFCIRILFARRGPFFITKTNSYIHNPHETYTSDREEGSSVGTQYSLPKIVTGLVTSKVKFSFVRKG